MEFWFAWAGESLGVNHRDQGHEVHDFLDKTLLFPH